MIYVLAILLGLVAAVAGWFLSGAAAAWIGGLAGMSDFEGARGMFAFLVVGPLGGLVAMIAAVWITLRVGRGRTSAGASLQRVGLALAGIAAVVGAGIALRLYAVDTYTNELPPTLEFEIRMPAAMTPADRGDLRIELHTDRNVGDSWLADPWVRDDGDQRLIAGGVPLAFKTTSRLLVVGVPGQPVRLFNLRIGRNPSSTPALGEWHHADHLDDAGEDPPRKAPADDPVELRYRISRAGEE